MTLGAPFAPGTRLGRYELLATIGKGGMASVILARQRGPGGFEKTVVIKVIHPHMAQDRAAINMLLDEARLAAQIDHPNVVHTYELGEAHGTFYIVMEYLAGESFARVLKKAAMRHPPPLQPTVAARIVADAAAGLAAAHNLIGVDGKPLDIVHRDVSPGNIVVLFNGSVKVVDFGIAKAQGRVTSTQDGELKGKYGYMSPEQIRNENMDRRSDIFSLGVVLWESLALRRLFQADNVAATLMQILTSQRVPPSQFSPDVSHELDQITLKALAPDPRDRFQSMAEMHKAIEDAIWQSRCGSQEVATQMQWYFSDRIEQRRALLSRATQDQVPLTDGDIDQIGQVFNNASNSAVAPPPMLPLAAMGPSAQMASISPSASMIERVRVSNNRRTFFAIAVLGTIAGVLAAVLVTGKDDDGLTIPDAQTTVVKPTVQPIDHDKPDKPDKPDKIAVVPGSNAVKNKPEVITELAPDENVTRPDIGQPTVVGDDPTPPTPQTGDRIKTPPVGGEPVRPARKSVDELLKSATAKFIEGDFGAAESLFKQVLAQDRGNAAAHKGLGFLYQRTGQKVKALSALRTYLKLSPNAKDAASVRKRIQELEQ